MNDEIKSLRVPPLNPGSPLPATRTLEPSLTPCGMVTLIFSVPIWYPLPPHCVHGLPICPCPLHWGRALVNCMGPSPRSAARNHRNWNMMLILELGSIPDPLHPEQGFIFCMDSSVSKPFKAEIRSISMSCWISVPREVARLRTRHLPDKTARTTGETEEVSKNSS